MLSYRHAFHAGNHADVLKHWILVEVLSYLSGKETPWAYLDTHAGGGVTDLEAAYARKLGEYRAGIGKVWRVRQAAPVELHAYLNLVEAFNSQGKLRWYPGSGMLAYQLARSQDRLHLFELHPTDYASLAKTFARNGSVHCYREDGFKGLVGLLPPSARRGCILIDPSYELDLDLTRTLEAVQAALKRFPQGVYLIWYPRLAKLGVERMVSKLIKLMAEDYLKVELCVRQPPRNKIGMFGSGVIVLNPPWTLPARCQQVLPWLAACLKQDEQAGYSLEYRLR
jgi:23S rRNA (adenine2030-N6)-methyltransferase